MYTATLIYKVLDETRGDVNVQVQFTNGTRTFNKDFVFSGDTTNEQMKLTVKRFKERLEASEAKVTQLVEGTFDFTGVAEPTPTVDEVAKNTWFRDFGRLQSAYRLVEMGVFAGSEAAYVTLKDKVKTGFKAAYLNDM